MLNVCNTLADIRASLYGIDLVYGIGLVYGIDLIYGIEHDDNTAVIPEGSQSDAIYSLTVS